MGRGAAGFDGEREKAYVSVVLALERIELVIDTGGVRIRRCLSAAAAGDCRYRHGGQQHPPAGQC